MQLCLASARASYSLQLCGQFKLIRVVLLKRMSGISPLRTHRKKMMRAAICWTLMIKAVTNKSSRMLSLKDRLEDHRRRLTSTSNTCAQLKDPSSLKRIIPARRSHTTPPPSSTLNRQISKRNSPEAVYEFASGASRPSQTGAITAPNATSAYSRWTIIAPGSPIVSDSTTTSSS